MWKLSTVVILTLSGYAQWPYCQPDPVLAPWEDALQGHWRGRPELSGALVIHPRDLSAEGA